MFAVIRHYHFDPKDGAEIDRRIREEFVPIVKSAKGFVRYYWLDTGDGEGASLSVYKDKAGADESVRLAADYVKEHLSKLLTQKPEIIEGPVKAHDNEGPRETREPAAKEVARRRADAVVRRAELEMAALVVDVEALERLADHVVQMRAGVLAAA